MFLLLLNNKIYLHSGDSLLLLDFDIYENINFNLQLNKDF